MTANCLPLRVGVIIPARNEEATVGKVVTELLSLPLDGSKAVVVGVTVCDNASTDRTAAIASAAGAMVVTEPIPGYGGACLAALADITDVDAYLFVDADGQFDCRDAVRLIDKIVQGADLVIGSRSLGTMDSGALSATQKFGNWLATRMIARLWGHHFTDLGPYRVIRAKALAGLHMESRTFGWTVEMQVKAVQAGLVSAEVPVSTRRRIGRSRISGTLRGVILAGYGIIGTIVSLWWQEKTVPDLAWVSPQRPPNA